jgi:YspA, cpYpsA-related SLOG family
MRILIAGDRNWTNNTFIRVILDSLVQQYSTFTLIHGGARGVDSIAGYIAEHVYKLPVIAFPADWDTHGKSAGIIRNRQMLSEGRPDLVVVIHNNLLGSKGTQNMFYIAGVAKIPRVWYTGAGKQHDERDTIE